jgi:hypothetical protein
VLAHDIFAEARTLVDAEHSGNATGHTTDDTANNRANGASRRAAFSCAAFRAADHTLCSR